MNFDLSPLAVRMLERGLSLEKDGIGKPLPPGKVPTVEQVEGFFRDAGCSLDHPAIEFHRRWGGREYHIRFDHNGRIYLGLDQYPAIGSGLDEDGHCYSIVASYSLVAVPFEYRMDEQGLIYADFQPYASSITVKIEGDAVEDSLVDKASTWLHRSFHIPASECQEFRRRMAALGLNMVVEASDQYGSFWLSETLAVRESQFINDRCDTLHIAVWALSGTDLDKLLTIVSDWTDRRAGCSMRRLGSECTVRIGAADYWVDIGDQLRFVNFDWHYNDPMPEAWTYWQHHYCDLLGLKPLSPQEPNYLYELEITLQVTPDELDRLHYIGDLLKPSNEGTIIMRYPIHKNAYLAQLAASRLR